MIYMLVMQWCAGVMVILTLLGFIAGFGFGKNSQVDRKPVFSIFSTATVTVGGFYNLFCKVLFLFVSTSCYRDKILEYL